MPASQFTLYSSSDVSGPGLIEGVAGDLLRVLDACLVNGYSGKAAAGWSKPFANSGSIGCYKNGATVPAGLNPATGLSVLVNDNGPNGTSTYKEAWLTGWESIAGIGAPVGTGSGQFPTPAQSLTTGHVVCRKSTTADATGRSWQIYADYATAYLFMATGDATGFYSHVGFGDIFSVLGATDLYRFLLFAGWAENGYDVGHNAADSVYIGSNGFEPFALASNGFFMPRSYGGNGTSIAVNRYGDLTGTVFTLNGFTLWNGNLQTPNGPDNSLYFSPSWVGEPTNLCRRGRMRGIYCGSHPPYSFGDGQSFQGGNDYAGKVFTVVKGGGSGGYWIVETSATVETN